MKLLLSIFAICLCVPLQAAPILRFEFAHPGASQTSTGTSPLMLTTYRTLTAPEDYIASLPSGGPSVSTNNVLDFRLKNTDNFKASAVSLIEPESANDPLTDNLGSFTVTAWVSNLNAKTDRRRLFFLSGDSDRAIDIFFSQGANGNNVISLAVGASALAVPERPATSAPDVNVPNGSEEWYFVAVTYDAATGSVTFYAGAKSSLLEMSTTLHVDSAGDVYPMPGNITTLNIGNSAIGGTGLFDGCLSDVRFYGEVLDEEALDALHAVIESAATTQAK